VGLHALSLARSIGTDGHLILCEDDTRLRRALMENLKANRVGNVTLLKRSLGRTTNIVPMINRGARVASPSVQAPFADSIADTIDDLQLESLHWLKLGEYVRASDLLEGAANTLWRLRPKLFVAAPDEGALGHLTRRARDFGYCCWRMDTPLFNPGNFNRREADIFSGRRSLALLAVPEEIEFDPVHEGCTRFG
jgi:hypothetical protein